MAAAATDVGAAAFSSPDILGEILDEFDGLAQTHGRVAVADMVDAMGPRSYGPFLLVPALIEISPLGGVPGTATALAAVVVLFAVQMLSGRKRLWMPGWVARRGVAAARMKRMVAGARPMAARMDRWFHGRLRWLTSGLGIRLAARGPVHTNFGDRVARPGGWMQGARVQRGRYLASAGNAADSPQAGQPEGKALAGAPLVVAFLACASAHAASRP